VTGVLGIASEEVADVRMNVQKLFDNLLNVVQAVIDYLSTNALRMSGAIVGLSAHSETLKALAEALEPLKNVLDVVMPILQVAATQVEQLKFGLIWVFDNIIKLMGEVETWITNQGPDFVDDMNAFRDQFQPALDAMRQALEPLGQLGATIDTVLSQMEKLNPSRVHAAFIGYLRQTLLNLKEDLQHIKPEMDEIQPLADQIAEIMKNINVALQVCLGLLAFATPEEETGYETGLMEGVLIALNLAIAKIKAALEGFYNWLNGPYRTKLAGLSYYKEGYAAGESWLKGFKAGSGQASPSVPMLEAGQNLIKGLIQGIESMIPALDKTLQKIADRFVRHSPIKAGPLAKIDWDDFPVIGPEGPIGPPPPPIHGGEEVFEEIIPSVGPMPGALGGGATIVQIAAPPIQVMGDVIVRREEDHQRWERRMRQIVVEMLPDVIVPAVDASQDKKAKKYGRFGVSG